MPTPAQTLLDAIHSKDDPDAAKVPTSNPQAQPGTFGALLKTALVAIQTEDQLQGDLKGADVESGIGTMLQHALTFKKTTTDKLKFLKKNFDQVRRVRQEGSDEDHFFVKNKDDEKFTLAHEPGMNVPDALRMALSGIGGMVGGSSLPVAGAPGGAAIGGTIAETAIEGVGLALPGGSSRSGGEIMKQIGTTGAIEGGLEGGTNVLFRGAQGLKATRILARGMASDVAHEAGEAGLKKVGRFAKDAYEAFLGRPPKALNLGTATKQRDELMKELDIRATMAQRTDNQMIKELEDFASESVRGSAVVSRARQLARKDLDSAVQKVLRRLNPKSVPAEIWGRRIEKEVSEHASGIIQKASDKAGKMYDKAFDDMGDMQLFSLRNLKDSVQEQINKLPRAAVGERKRARGRLVSYLDDLKAISEKKVGKETQEILVDGKEFSAMLSNLSEEAKPIGNVVVDHLKPGVGHARASAIFAGALRDLDSAIAMANARHLGKGPGMLKQAREIYAAGMKEADAFQNTALWKAAGLDKKSQPSPEKLIDTLAGLRKFDPSEVRAAMRVARSMDKEFAQSLQAAALARRLEAAVDPRSIPGSEFALGRLIQFGNKEGRDYIRAIMTGEPKLAAGLSKIAMAAKRLSDIPARGSRTAVRQDFLGALWDSTKAIVARDWPSLASKGLMLFSEKHLARVLTTEAGQKAILGTLKFPRKSVAFARSVGDLIRLQQEIGLLDDPSKPQGTFEVVPQGSF